MSTKHAKHDAFQSDAAHSEPEAVVRVDISAELTAIRARITERRRMLFGHGNGAVKNPTAYTTTDLADAEWLLVELDKALGHPESLTPSEQAEFDALVQARKLDKIDQGVLDRLSSKHGELSMDDAALLNHLQAKQDEKLNVKELKRFHELNDKAVKCQHKANS